MWFGRVVELAIASAFGLTACAPQVELPAAYETSAAAGSMVDDDGAGVTFDGNDVTGPPNTSDATATSAASSPDLGDAETSDGGAPLCPGDPVHPNPDAPGCASDREGTWMPMSTLDAPSPRWGFTMIWSGEDAIVWGAGTDVEDVGAAYDPTEDVWRPLSTTGAPSFRRWHTAVWTGTEMIVWGGTQRASGSYEAFGDGARYRPEVDEWVSVTSLGAPSPRYSHSAVGSRKHGHRRSGRGEEPRACDSHAHSHEMCPSSSSPKHGELQRIAGLFGSSMQVTSSSDKQYAGSGTHASSSQHSPSH